MHSQLVKSNTNEAWRNIPEFDGVFKSINLIPDEKTRQLQVDKVKHKANTARKLYPSFCWSRKYMALQRIKCKDAKQTNKKYLHRYIVHHFSHEGKCFAALATNSHMAERGVKASNLCTLTNWPKYLLSAYDGTAARKRTQQDVGIAMYYLVHLVNENERMVRYMTRTTSQQQNGSVGGCTSSIGGSLHSEQAIKFVTDCHKFERACVNKNNLYSDSQVTLKTEEYKNTFNIEQTPNVPFGKLNMDRDWETLKLELVHRDLSTDGKWKACNMRLKNHEGDTHHFKVQSSAIFNWKQ
eukprot:scaffold5152_cov60-Attheya_sp.AAC.7